MNISEQAKQPVNPLTGDLTTIKISAPRLDSGTREAQCKVVAPGLAIAPHADNGSGKDPDRYSVIHIPSGLAVGTNYCGHDVQQAAQLAANTGIDWTADKDTVVAAAKEAPGFLAALSGMRCADWECAGDGPKPPSWGIRCETCDWQWDDEYDEGPVTSLEEARRIADDHECEPYVEIQAPDTTEWKRPYTFIGSPAVVDHGSVKPPYGTPERATYDAAEAVTAR